MTGKLLDLYSGKVARGEIEADAAQARTVQRLHQLSLELAGFRTSRTGVFGMFKRGRAPVPRGLYIHGGVGRGKTMLMDLFHQSVDFAPKRRSHFHEFMAFAHDRIAAARKTSEGDPIPVVAAEIAASAGLFCFDELHVTDIADAMILGRLFKVLLESGVVVVATSNAEPGDLYQHGLNRQLFLPFIDLIEDHMDVLELEAAKDFRLEKLSGRTLYFTPADAAALAQLDGHWDRLTGRHAGEPADLQFKGRKVHVPLSSMGVARFGFADLCDRPLGAGDYLKIAHAFHTILIDGIPKMSPQRRNEARRFITLIDTLYDSKVCLIASAEAEPHLLYPSGDGALMFERTASRLMEMRSEAYLAKLPDTTSRM